MKKKPLTLLLTIAVILTSTVTVFADGYSITNGTPEIAKDTNHGYITVDETAAEGDDVTITVNPAEGYQLKSLTATPVAPTISTIADVLATVEGFPASEDQNTPPSSAWVADVQNNQKCYAYTSVSGSYTSLLLRIPSVTYTFFLTTTEVTPGENCYTASNNLGTLTFNMENGILTSFKFTADPSKPNAANYVGTYTPINTPSARLKPIIPMQDTQDKTKYTFTMPAADVTIVAEFEVTIADILPSNFPASDEDNSWCNSENDNVYIYKTDSNLVFNDSTEDCYSVPLSSFLTKEKNPKVSYVYSVDGTKIQFNMTGDNDDELENIVVNDCTIPTCIGTYNPIEIVTYDVTYNANEATSGTAPANQTKTAGVDLALATNTGNLAKTDYTFAGWNTKADGSGTHYDTGATYTKDAALTLYAEWVAVPATKTIAEILETVDGGFPTTSASGWLNTANDSKSYIMNGNLFVYGKTNVELSKTVTKKDDGNYEYQGTSGTKITFVMESGKLTKINVSGSVYPENNGTYVAPHVHTFTYTANNNIITATCIEGCDKGYNTTPLTLTLTAPTSLVYDGNAKAFTFADGEADAWTGAGLELPTIFYDIKQSGQSSYLPLFGTLKYVGNYMAKISVDGKDAQVLFTIDKATPYIKTNPEPTDIDYGKKLADSTLAGGYVQVSSTNATQVGGLFEWTNSDTVPGLDDSEVTEYDVTFTPADTNNFNTVSCKVKIKVNHTHAPILVNGQAATETAFGWKDYYKCDCGALFEDENGTTLIDSLDTWKAEGGNGYIAQLIHTITSVNGKSPTETEAGYKPYYECKNCGKYYEDIDGLIEISDINVWKAEGGNGYIAPNYKIIEGNKANINIDNNEDILFTSSADYSKFSRVEIDGITVDSSNYKVEPGSTKVTLKASYLKTLSVGQHTVDIISTYGHASTTFTIAKNNPSPNPRYDIPKTGVDGVNNHSLLKLSSLLLLAIGAYIVIKKKKDN